MNYTNNPDQVVFLKDADIVQDIAGKNISGDSVERNGIASYDLVSAISSTASRDIEDLSGKHNTLSGRFDTEQAYNSSAVRYQGEVTLKDLYDILDGDMTVNRKLAALIMTSIEKFREENAKLSVGFLFKAVADDPAKEAYDFDGKTLHPNDYIFLKNNVNAVTAVTFDDVNIIRDYDLSVNNLQRDVNALTTTVDAEGTGLVAKVNSISTDVIAGSNSLSAKFGNLNTDFTNLSGKLLSSNDSLIPKLCTTVTATMWNSIKGISNEISADDGLSAKVMSISSSVITAENSLSDKFTKLSGDLLSAPSCMIPKLCSDISTIRADIKGGVVYQGHLKLDHLTDVYALSDYVAFLYDNNAYQHTPATLEKQLSNGWMYYIDFDPSKTGHAGITDVGSFETNETDEDNPHITFVPGNYIIVHSHNGAESITLSNLGRDEIDIIQVTDSDLVRFKNLNDVSTALCNSTTALVSSISNTLSDAINTHIEDYSLLCTDLSTAIATVTNDVNTTISNAIDNKVQLSVAPENGIGNPTTTNIDTLVINRMSILQYESLVEAGQTHNDLIYVINDDNLSLFGHDISNINDIQATSGHIDNVSAGSLTAAGSIQAAELNITGNAGTVNVANVNAISLISVAGDAFVASSNGNVVADKLSAVELSTPALSASSITAVAADLTTVNSSTVKSTNVSATQANADSLAVKNTCVVADKLTANNNGLSIDGNLSVNADVRAGNISAATISATDLIIVDGKLTATNGGLTANGKLSTNNDLDVAGNLSVGNTSLSAKGLTVDNSGINTPSLTATTISTLTLTVVNSIQLFNDQYGINKDATDNALNIKTPGAQNPLLKINGKYLTSYYAEYLSAEYLSDGYIESIETSMSNDISGIKITWNDLIKEGGSAKVRFIPLSSLGGIYDEAGTIIKVNKTLANSFKISADPAAISDAIDEALYDDFGIQGIKDELSSKILIQNGADAAQKVESMTIHKMSLDQYKNMLPDQRISTDIYVVEDDNIDAFNGKLINLAEPTVSNDAATKNYVDVMTAGAKNYSDTEIATVSAATLNSAKNYTNTVSSELNTALVNAIGTAKTEAITTANAYTDTASGALNDAITAINGKVDNKIQFREGDAPAENIQTLTIRKMTAAAYNDLTDVQKSLSNVIYSIEDSNYNMFGNRIVQLGAPSADTDAATKKYVDDLATATKSAISSNLTFSTDSNNSIIVLNVDGAPAASFSYSNFVKDSVLSAVLVSARAGSISTLVFKFKTEDETLPIAVDLTSFASLYEGGNYISLSSKAGNANIQTVNVNYGSLSSALADDITAVVKTALVGTNAGSDWDNVDSTAGLGRLSAAIKSNIKSSIEANDLTALYKNINGTGTAGAPDNGTSFYALSTGIKAELVGNSNLNDWTNVDPNSGLGVLSAGIFDAVKTKLTANHNISTELDDSNWLYFLTRNGTSNNGTWSAPLHNSPLMQFARNLSVTRGSGSTAFDGYATRTDVSAYCLKSELSIDTTVILPIEEWDGTSDLSVKINQIIETVNAIHAKLADLTPTA